MNDDLPILLIKQRDFNGNFFYLLFATWDTISYKTTDFSSWVTSYEIASVKRTSWVLKTFISFSVLLSQHFWMRHKLILILYFLSLAILILLLAPGYLLSVVQLTQLNKKFNNNIWMPHPTNQNPVVWNTLGDDGFDEIQHFNCSWTITTNNESITVNII